MNPLPLFDQGFYAAKSWKLPNATFKHNEEYMAGWWNGAIEQMEEAPPYSSLIDELL